MYLVEVPSGSLSGGMSPWEFSAGEGGAGGLVTAHRYLCSGAEGSAAERGNRRWSVLLIWSLGLQTIASLILRCQPGARTLTQSRRPSAQTCSLWSQLPAQSQTTEKQLDSQFVLEETIFLSYTMGAKGKFIGSVMTKKKAIPK